MPHGRVREILLSLLILVAGVTAVAREITLYKVQRGDTLPRLSWEYDVSPDAIRAANRLDSDTLQIGMELVIPPHGSSELEAPAIPRASIPTPPAVPIPRATAILFPGQPPSVERQSEKTPPSAVAAAPRDLRQTLTVLTRALAEKGIPYNGLWTPPGCHSAWRMDCSNTTRYLYIAAAGLDLGRTASDQYEFLSRQGRAWHAPTDWHGITNVERLGKRLKAGDLLFWENTYRPERRSSVTHVMIFLGSDEGEHWLMAGSRGHRAGGPDIYRFDPHQPAGGFSSFFGLIHHQGRFIGYGRPVS